MVIEFNVLTELNSKIIYISINYKLIIYYGTPYLLELRYELHNHQNMGYKAIPILRMWT